MERRSASGSDVQGWLAENWTILLLMIFTQNAARAARIAKTAKTARLALLGAFGVFVASGFPPLRSFGGPAVALAEAGSRTTPVAAQSSSSVKAFTGARVIDGTTRAPIDN